MKRAGETFRNQLVKQPPGGYIMENSVRAIDRVLDILEKLSEANSPMSLTELSAATGMSKSTIHRLLATLLARQYIEKRSSGMYTIGYKMMEVVSNHINGLELLTEAKPFLTQLSKDLGLTTHMGILDGHDVVYIGKIDYYSDPRLYTQVGYHSPAYCSSMGKCLLSCLSSEELDEVLYDWNFEKFTANTITDHLELRRSLRIIRKQGWAMDNEEYQKGHRCVAAPVFDYRGSAVAAFSASGSIHTLSDDRLEEVISSVREATAEISRRMGYVE